MTLQQQRIFRFETELLLNHFSAHRHWSRLSSMPIFYRSRMINKQTFVVFCCYMNKSKNSFLSRYILIEFAYLHHSKR